MLLTLDPQDNRPLYIQIASAIRRNIATGALEPGQRLPSGRDLAAATDVTLETVQRAYRVLKDEGLVVSRVGRGTSVAADVAPNELALTDQIDALINAARAIGVDRKALALMIAGDDLAG